MELGWSSREPEFTLSSEEKQLASRVLQLFYANSASRSTLSQKDGAILFTEILRDLCRRQALALPPESSQRIIATCTANSFGLAGLEKLFVPGVEEICIASLSKPAKFYSTETGWQESTVTINSEQYFIELVNRLAAPLERTITRGSPRLSAVLPNGARMHAVIPPASAEPSLNLRVLPSEPFSPVSFVSREVLTPSQLALLWSAVETDCNLLICGNTGSGKTSFLNSLTAFLPPGRRIISIEETPELTFPKHPHVVRLVSGNSQALEMATLVRDTLRMRPDNVIIGEIRSPQETTAYVDSLTAGQAKATWATFHAEDAKQATNRLVRLGGVVEEINAIDLVIVLRRETIMRGSRELEQRRILSITNPGGENVEKKLVEKLASLHSIPLASARKLLLNREAELVKIAQTDTLKYSLFPVNL